MFLIQHLCIIDVANMTKGLVFYKSIWESIYLYALLIVSKVVFLSTLISLSPGFLCVLLN